VFSDMLSHILQLLPFLICGRQSQILQQVQSLFAFAMEPFCD